MSEFSAWRNPAASSFAVEIGCGVGFHPILWAKENVGGQILAIERTHEKFGKFENRLKHHPDLQTQVFAAHADADWLLPHLFKASELSVDEYFWLYPNPEPKRRNHRIAYSNLTAHVVSSLKSGGRLTFATNISSYAEEVRRELPLQFGLKLLTDEILTQERKPRSHFEKKYLLRGERCENLVFIKPSL